MTRRFFGMRRLLFILFLSFSLFYAQSQKTIKTETPCSDQVLFNTPGKWFTDYGGLLDNGSEYIPLNKAQVNEAITRMNAVRDMLMKIYPEPIGVDPAWHHSIGRGSFAEQVKYVQRGDRFDREALVEKPVASYGFFCGFFRHVCNGQNPHEIWHGFPGETDTWFTVGANGIGNVAAEVRESSNNTLIGGYPVHLRHPIKEKFDGYEFFNVKTDVFPDFYSGTWRILIHRKGELPYTPVTRKQYLDQAIIYLTQFYGNALKDFEQAPMQSKEEQDIRKEQIKSFIKNRDAVLDHYKDELEESSKKGLLGSPAIIPQVLFAATEGDQIFVEENLGYMVVIENPAYMRKDLPKWVPQILTVSMAWNEEWKPQADAAKLILEKFPFAQLQAMIDK